MIQKLRGVALWKLSMVGLPLPRCLLFFLFFFRKDATLSFKKHLKYYSGGTVWGKDIMIYMEINSREVQANLDLYNVFLKLVTISSTTFSQSCRALVARAVKNILAATNIFSGQEVASQVYNWGAALSISKWFKLPSCPWKITIQSTLTHNII